MVKLNVSTSTISGDTERDRSLSRTAPGTMSLPSWLHARCICPDADAGLHSEVFKERRTGEGVSFTRYNVTFVASPGRSKPQSIESAGSFSPGSQ